MSIEPVAYMNPLVEGMTDPDNPHPPWPDDKLYDWLYDRGSLPQYNSALIHMPQGWIHTMSSAPWLGMTASVQEVWTEVLGRIIAERPGYEWTLYSGWQMSNAYTIYGRPRPSDGRGFIGEPDWADADNPQHVRMLRDLNVQEWADRGVTKFVFDSGSKDPREIVRWRRKLRRVVKTVGLEAIPWLGGQDADAHIDWQWCRERGLEYHGNQRFRAGRPFHETVPAKCVGRAFVWLVHMMDPEPTPHEIADMMDRGWTPVVLHTKDDLMAAAWDIYTRMPDTRRDHGRTGDNR